MTTDNSKTKNVKDFDEKDLTYLQMIQSAIDRMSTSSAIFKGFAATIVAGVSMISFGELKLSILVLSFIPILAFLILDVYYLQIERRYRFLYEEVRNKKRQADFDMMPPSIRKIKGVKSNVEKKTCYISCLMSKSILLFYIPIILVCVVIIILKAEGVI